MNKVDDILEQLKGQQPTISDPEALTDRIMDSLESLPQPQSKARTISLWHKLSIAASILFIIGIGTTLMLTDRQEQQSKPIVAKATPKKEEVKSIHTISPKPSDSQSEAVEPTVRSRRTAAKAAAPPQQSRVVEPTTVTLASKASETEEEPMNDPNLHYASNELTKDTVPYQDPARIDEFIAKMAAYNNVKQGELKCSQPIDGDVVSSVYVFPDKDEIDVFSRLLQVACCYDSKTPGYLLNFSQQQFYFELKDLRKQLQYRWIAERVSGKILLYGTHAPLGTKESSACYQEYRDELMYKNSINIKIKKI